MTISRKNHDLLKDEIKKSGLDNPSPQFTSDIMGRLGIEYKLEYLTYTPLITKKHRNIIIFIILGIFILTAIFSGSFSGIKIFEIGKLPEFSLPEIKIDLQGLFNSSFGGTKYWLFFPLISITILTYILMDKFLRKFFKPY